MSLKPQKAVLLRTLFVNSGHRIQKGVEVELLSIGVTGAFISVDRNSFLVPQHFVAIIPPDSSRVHKNNNHNKQTLKR